MTRYEAARRPFSGSPSGRLVAGRTPRSGVQPKTGDDGKGVAVSRVDGDPLAATSASVSAKFFRAQRSADQPGGGQGIRNSAGAIVTTITEGTMPTAIAIWFCAKLIGRPDGALNGEGRIDRRGSQAAAKTGLLAGNGRAGGGERARKTNGGDQRCNGAGQQTFSNGDSHERLISV